MHVKKLFFFPSWEGLGVGYSFLLPPSSVLLPPAKLPPAKLPPNCNLWLKCKSDILPMTYLYYSLI